MSILLTIFIIGFFASIMSGLAGGGAGLVMIPLLLMLGIDPKIASVTTNFGAIGLGIGSIFRFKKEKNLRKDYLIPLLSISIISGLVGPYLLFAINTENLQKLIGAIILICVPMFVLKSNLGVEKKDTSAMMKLLGFIFYFIILTLQVAFGSGTGVAIIFSLVIFFGFSMIETNATLRVPQLLSSIISLIIFAKNDVIRYDYGFVLLVAMIFGGYVGSHLAIKSGNRFVKYSFLGLAVMLGMLLLK